MIYNARASGGEHGVVMTKPEIVQLMLDICEYTADKDLSTVTLLEPAAGQGAFLGACIKRLYSSSVKFGFDFTTSLSNLKAVELDQSRSASLRTELSVLLTKYGVEESIGTTENMIITGDYLLSKIGKFDIIIGNPPYVRHENIPKKAKEQYRYEFDTFRHRSDIYVAFFEKSLRNLTSNGSVCFICSDRWMQNTYGGGLRQYVTKSFYVPLILNLHKINAFEETVYGYPSITLISKTPCAVTQYREVRTTSELSKLKEIVAKRRLHSLRFELLTLPKNSDPWIFNRLYSLLPKASFSKIESQGFEIGIGIATGADAIYIRKDLKDLVEAELLLPVVKTHDIKTGQIRWGGNYVINVFDSKTGSLIDLNSYPRLKRYFNINKNILVERHVAKKRNGNWYRTIDKINPLLTNNAKLLLVDIKKDQWAPLDLGGYYPHHNLYYITGRPIQDLKVLGAILRSKFFTEQLVSSSPVMHGGYPRWQAQNVRRILVPTMDAMSAGTRQSLADCYDVRNLTQTNEIMDEYVRSVIGDQNKTLKNALHLTMTHRIRDQKSLLETVSVTSSDCN